MQLIRTNQPELVRKLSVFTVSLLLLFFGFFSNSWHVAEEQWFLRHQRDTESLIVGRLVKSRQDGIFSAGGLTGAGVPNNYDQEWISSEQVSDQYAAYLNGLTFEQYSPYLSQTGGQGMLFGLLDGLIPLSPETKLTAFYLLTSLLSAIALTSISVWFFSEFNWSAALFVAGSMIISQWLTVFGRNLWWSVWAFYLPMIAFMYFLQYRREATYHHLVILGLLSFVAVFVKCFINGYEYITTTLIMMFVPFVYYAIVDRLSVRQFLTGTVMAACGSLLAILLSVMLLSVQIAAVKGDLLDGFEHVIYSLGKRSYGDAQRYPEIYAASLESNTMQVAIGYWKGTFFDINNYLTTSNSFVSHYLFKIRYFYLFILFLAMSFLVVRFGEENISNQDRKRDIALVVTTWASILAPLSWFVIFKGHSYLHKHMNYVLWQMPFTLFGFAVCGLVFQRAYAAIFRPTGR